MKGSRGMVCMETGMPPCYSIMAFCKILSLQYSWLLDGCNLSLHVYEMGLFHMGGCLPYSGLSMSLFTFCFYPLVVTINAAIG